MKDISESYKKIKGVPLSDVVSHIADEEGEMHTELHISPASFF